MFWQAEHAYNTGQWVQKESLKAKVFLKREEERNLVNNWELWCLHKNPTLDVHVCVHTLMNEQNTPRFVFAKIIMTLFTAKHVRTKERWQKPDKS